MYKELALNKIYQAKAFDFIKSVIKPKQKILELGCSDGSFANFVAKNTDAEVYGVDISPDGIRSAKKQGIKAQIHDLSKELPFKNGQFDLVFTLEVIEHLLDTDFYLEEINRILKKNGYFIISTPNLGSLTNRIRLGLGKYPRFLDYTRKDWGNHVHLYTLDALKKQIRQHGFEIIRVTSPNFLNPFITKSWCPEFIKNISMQLGDLFPSLGSHIVILAQKSSDH